MLVREGEGGPWETTVLVREGEGGPWETNEGGWGAGLSTWLTAGRVRGDKPLSTVV